MLPKVSIDDKSLNDYAFLGHPLSAFERFMVIIIGRSSGVKLRLEQRRKVGLPKCLVH